ncbi:T9SS type A sorting domain-containing protein [Rufibacter sp. LB8]|uniref:T9SS type A sorting domain-containing protein n=1 Tax=Rufibacter sp. LB8 TaxID=2777781 RepID=UPI00178C3BB5|nr:T9SS type A sorting domain-containing protein [Rufibacter sp. LB8]
MRISFLFFLNVLIGLFLTTQSVQANPTLLLANTDSLKTLPLAGNTYCVGSTFTVPFETEYTFPSDNVFTVQLSSSSGAFTSPRALGTAAGTGSGSIEVTLPLNITSGTAYRIRVVASKPPTDLVVRDNGTNLTIGTPFAAPTITANDGLCAGGTLSLSANNISGATYAWTGPNNFTSTSRTPTIPNVSTAAAGMYTVVVTLRGCTNSASREITIKPATADAGPDRTICIGQSVQLEATGGVSYSWSPTTTLNDPKIANPVATPTATTTYTVTVTNENGCVRTDQVVITVAPLPVLTIAPAAASICIGSSVQLQASGAVSYSWSPAIGLDDPTSATPIASPTATTTYTVTGTSAAGCVNTKTVVVTVKALPIANAGFDRSICSGQALTLGGTNTTNGVYLWEPAIGLSSATLKNPLVTLQNTTSQPITTIYKLTVISNGCTNTDEVAITVNPSVPANAGPDRAICLGGSTQLNATGGTGYRWSPTTNLSDPNSPNPVAFPTATTRYIVTVTNAEGCSRNDTVFVNVNPVPVVTVTPAAPSICIGSSVQLQATGAVTYAWSPATGLSDSTTANPIASPSATTTYTVIGYSAAGCASAAKTITVRVNPYPIANAGLDKTVCSRQATIVGVPAVPGYTYSWSPATGLNNPKAANPTLTYPGDSTTRFKVTYTLTVTANGCSSTDVVEVTVNPTAYAGPAVTICPGGSTQLQASGGASYSWSPATGLSDPTIANPIASPTATTTYTVTVTNPDGLCTSSSSVRVTMGTFPTIAATTSETNICPGSPVNLTATGGTRYTWFPETGLSNPAIANPVATPTETTTYTVTGYNAAGCSSTAQVTVTVKPLPQVTLDPFGPICLEKGNITLTGGSPAGGTYTGPGITNNILDPRAAGEGTFTISYTYSDPAVDCPVTVTQPVTIANCLSAADEAQAATLSAYPNPAQTELLVTASVTKTESIALQLVDMKGNVVYQKSIKASAGELKHEIQVGQLPQGLYVLHYRTAAATTTRKIVISR